MSVSRSRIGSNGHGPQVRSVGLLLFEAAKQGSLENLEFALGLPGGKSQLELGREGSILTDAFVKCPMKLCLQSQGTLQSNQRSFIFISNFMIN